MSSPLSNISSLLGIGPRKMTPQQKLRRILASAAAQRAELHLVFGQRLARPAPIRGRFMDVGDSGLQVVLDVSAVDDAWQNEPCSAYFSVRCPDLSGSYAFATRMLAHKTKQDITHARLAIPNQCTSRQVRRFERLTPGEATVQRMAVWNLKNFEDAVTLNAISPQQQQSLRIMARMQEPMPLSALLPVHLQALGPPDYQMGNCGNNCALFNISAGGARITFARTGSHAPLYAERDNILVLLALTRQKLPPLLISLAGACTHVLGGSTGQDVRMRFIYWNGNTVNQAAHWAPVTLNGVTPLYQWVAQGLGIEEGKKKGVETLFDAPRSIPGL